MVNFTVTEIFIFLWAGILWAYLVYWMVFEGLPALFM